MTLLEALDIKKWNYGNYSSNNYGNHTTAIRVKGKTYYFSYNTLIAFRGANSQGKYFDCCIKNYWNNTTGKHLNWINPNHKTRLEEEEFIKQFEEFNK